MNEFPYPYEDDRLPYNPNDVDVRQQQFSVKMIAEMIKEGEIELWRQNDFQRLSGLWSNEQKSRLIESLIMRIPLPIFYLDGSGHPWKIVDGLQRLSVFDEFINRNSLVLRGLEYLTELEGERFNTLPFSYQRSILNADLTAYVISPGTPDSVKFNIFQRINTGGLKLRPQEIRNGFFSGRPVDIINSLANDPIFRHLTAGKIPAKRMRDREFVLRFYSFYRYLDRYQPPMDTFLNIAMQTLYEVSDTLRDELLHRFHLAMETCEIIFGDRAFFLLNRHGMAQTSTLNISLFETWAVNLATLFEDQHDLIRQRRESILNDFLHLLENVDFYRSISSLTTRRDMVDLRFSLVHDLIYSTVHA